MEIEVNVLKCILSTAAVIGLAAPHGLSYAQAYPSKPVRIIVPYAAGGAADGLMRAITTQLSQGLGQPVVVENRPGAAGMIGAEALARAAPDGYTIGLLSTPIAAMPFVSKPNFDISRLKAVAHVASVPQVLSVNAETPVRNLNELIAWARSQPGKLSFGHAGNLTVGHLSVESFKARTKLDITAIAYKGGAPAINDALGGQIPMVVGAAGTHVPFYASGRLRPIATSGIKRSIATPDVPTYAESGLPGFDLSEWFILFAPDNTPAEAIARLNREILKAVAAPEVKVIYDKLGAEVIGGTPAEAAAFYRNETEKVGKLVTSLGLKAD